jgi:hypothetical protein
VKNGAILAGLWRCFRWQQAFPAFPRAAGVTIRIWAFPCGGSSRRVNSSARQPASLMMFPLPSISGRVVLVVTVAEWSLWSQWQSGPCGPPFWPLRALPPYFANELRCAAIGHSGGCDKTTWFSMMHFLVNSFPRLCGLVEGVQNVSVWCQDFTRKSAVAAALPLPGLPSFCLTLCRADTPSSIPARSADSVVLTKNRPNLSS